MTTAAIRRFSIPSPEELVERARGMVPELRSLAEETERNRNVLPQIIDTIRDAALRGLRLDRLGGQWCGLQRPVDRPLSNRGAARGLGCRRRPVHLRLFR